MPHLKKQSASGVKVCEMVNAVYGRKGLETKLPEKDDKYNTLLT